MSDVYDFQRRFNEYGEYFDDPEAKSPTQGADGPVRPVARINTPHMTPVLWGQWTDPGSATVRTVFPPPFVWNDGVTRVDGRLDPEYYWRIYAAAYSLSGGGALLIRNFVRVRPYMPGTTTSFLPGMEFMTEAGLHQTGTTNVSPFVSLAATPFPHGGFLTVSGDGSAAFAAWFVTVYGYRRAAITETY